MPIKLFTVKYEGYKKLSSKFIRAQISFLNLEDKKAFSAEYTVGQYVTFLIDNKILPDLGRPVRRSYSLADGSIEIEKNNRITTIVDISPGGPGSQMFLNAEIGQEIRILGPIGKFILGNEDLDHVFFATGAGIVPYYAMLKDMVSQKMKNTRVKLIWGLRNREDYILIEDLENLSKKLNLEIKICFSNESNITGTEFSGRVTNYTLEKIDEFEPDMQYYLCGNHGMINEMKSILVPNVAPIEMLKSEEFY